MLSEFMSCVSSELDSGFHSVIEENSAILRKDATDTIKEALFSCYKAW